MSLEEPFSSVFSRLRIDARVFFTGQLCGVAEFTGEDGPGHLHLLRAGSLRVMDGEGREHQVLAPAAVLFPRSSRHRLDSEDAQLVCAEIDLGGVANPFHWALPPVMWLALDRPGELLGGVLELLFREAAETAPGHQAAMNRLAEIALIHLLRHALAAPSLDGGLLAGLAHPQLSRALGLMHGDPGRSLNLDDLAAACGLSRSAFAECFRRVVGRPPGQYLAAWRLSLAREAIAQGRPVKTVAREVGYQSAAALSRAFSRHFGREARSVKAREP